MCQPDRHVSFYRLASAENTHLGELLSKVPALADKERRVEQGGTVVVKGMGLDDVRAALSGVASGPGWKLIVGKPGVHPPVSDEAVVYAVLEAPVLVGSSIREASVQFDDGGTPDVSVTFSDEAKEIFGKVTSETVGEPLPIVFEGDILMAPQVREPITGGRARITLGSGDPKSLLGEAREVAAVLNAGALTQTLKLIERTTTCP